MSCVCCKTADKEKTDGSAPCIRLDAGECLRPSGHKSDGTKRHSWRQWAREKGAGDAKKPLYKFPKQPALSFDRTWKDLLQLKMGGREKTHMISLFRADAGRFKKYSIELTSPHGNLLLDYSKNWLNQEIFTCLMKLLKDRDVDVLSRAMFAGERINFSENKEVLHMALRKTNQEQVKLDGNDVMPLVKNVLNRMKEFSDGIIKGTIRSQNRQKFTDCVSVGVGGCYLGPLMVTEALKPFIRGPRCHFVSNIDGSDLVETLKDLNAETTLIIIISKSFTAQETMMNAEGAKRWLMDKIGDEDVALRHMVAVTANLGKAQAFGIDEKNIFEVFNWVNDRYSLWSAVGLPIAISIGMDNFIALLEGAKHMDEHFLKTPMEENIPMILAALGIWYTDFYFLETHAILPYDQYLHRFPSYIQHLDMESNGKSVTRNKTKVETHTGPIIWGEPGTNSQHAFHQLLHQGTTIVPCDFIVPIKSHKPVRKGLHHNILLSHYLAQTEALMKGKSLAEVEKELKDAGMSPEAIKRTAPHKVMEGDRPSNSILVQQINPFTLGMLIAMYEMKIFVQGCVWGINSFDQWGAELGKTLATTILKELDSDQDYPARHDSSTVGLLKHIKSHAPKMYRPYKDIYRPSSSPRLSLRSSLSIKFSQY